ncbi:MAG: sulfocyanin-like copper-binding protein [Gemmatimonadota bacterium]
MKRPFTYSTAFLFALTMAACGGGEPAEEAPATEEEAPAAEEAAGAVTMPEWMSHDEGAETLEMTLIAGETTENNAWNFNGYYGGEGEVFIPVGTEVTLTLENQDQNMAHSVGVGEERSNFPANFSNPTPVFEGAMTSNPTSLNEATLPGESETITFTVDEAGEYSLICYVPGHAAVGMYLHLTVTEDGQVGFRG